MTEDALLYCYGGPELLDSLKRNLLPLVDWDTMTNPWFHCETGVGNEASAVTADQWQAALEARYAAIPDHLRGAVDFSYFAEKMEAKRPEIEADIRASGQTTEAGDLDTLRHQSVAVLRLLETPLNPLGWQLLGSQYRGVCVGLLRSQGLFKAAPNKPRILKHVRYAPHRSLTGSDTMPFPGWFEEPEALSALNEWRLALPRKHARKVGDQYWLPLEAGSVKAIYIGPLASEETLQAVTDLQRLYQRYRSCQRLRVHPAHRSFTLQGSYE